MSFPILDRRRTLVRFQDGIHLDFKRDFHYVKEQGGKVTRAPFTSLFTFTGDNQSKYRGGNGLLIPSQTNTPRIEYDASGNVLGLLVEGSRTNLGLWSNDLTNAAWVKSSVTAAMTATGPDGVTNSATTLTATGANGTCLQSITSASATRDNSVWLKRRTGTGNIDMTVDNGTGWTTKAITTTWDRYDITQAAVTNPIFGLRIVTSGDAIDVYGEQIESASFRSSTIPTTTVSVTRADELVQRIAGGEISSLAGTIFAEFDTPNVSLFDGRIFVMDDGIGNNRFAIRSLNGTFNSFTLSGGVGDGSANAPNTISNPNVLVKGVAALSANDLIAVLSAGATTGTDSALTLPVGLNRVNLGWDPSGGGGARLFGHIRRLDYWPTRLSDATLQRLTA